MRLTVAIIGACHANVLRYFALLFPPRWWSTSTHQAQDSQLTRWTKTVPILVKGALDGNDVSQVVIFHRRGPRERPVELRYGMCPQATTTSTTYIQCNGIVIATLSHSIAECTLRLKWVISQVIGQGPQGIQGPFRWKHSTVAEPSIALQFQWKWTPGAYDSCSRAVTYVRYH